MTQIDLDGIVTLVLHRARRQGFVRAREIREELAQAGLAESLWKDVLALARSSLRYQQGRYQFLAPTTTHMRQRVRQEQVQFRAIRNAIRQLIRLYKTAPVRTERRFHPRIETVRPLQVQSENRQLLKVVSRDISVSGIRLLGTCPLVGQKVRVWIPFPEDGDTSCCFLVHILWSAPAGDGLVENGGIFLDMLKPSEW